MRVCDGIRNTMRRSVIQIVGTLAADPICVSGTLSRFALSDDVFQSFQFRLAAKNAVVLDVWHTRDVSQIANPRVRLVCPYLSIHLKKETTASSLCSTNVLRVQFGSDIIRM